MRRIDGLDGHIEEFIREHIIKNVKYEIVEVTVRDVIIGNVLDDVFIHECSLAPLSSRYVCNVCGNDSMYSIEDVLRHVIEKHVVNVHDISVDQVLSGIPCHILGLEEKDMNNHENDDSTKKDDITKNNDATRYVFGFGVSSQFTDDGNMRSDSVNDMNSCSKCGKPISYWVDGIMMCHECRGKYTA